MLQALSRLQASLEAGQPYEGHELFKTVFHRFRARKLYQDSYGAAEVCTLYNYNTFINTSSYLILSYLIFLFSSLCLQSKGWSNRSTSERSSQLRHRAWLHVGGRLRDRRVPSNPGSGAASAEHHGSLSNTTSR